jgi:hypothetical protein
VSQRAFLLLALAAALFSFAASAALAQDCNFEAETPVVQARSNEAASMTLGSCSLKPAGVDSLVVPARLSSQLVRARGQVVARFFSANGESLGSWESEPFLGQFSDLSASWSVDVPVRAVKATFSLAVNSNRPDAAGSMAAVLGKVGPGIRASLTSIDGEVVDVGAAPRWMLDVPAAPQGSTVEWRVSDVDGVAVAEAPARAVAKGRDSWQAPVLRPGYYVVTALLQAPGRVERRLSRSLVVLRPALFTDPRFGVDAALSWYGGDEASVRRAAAMLGRAGVGAVRDRLSWARVQPSPNRIDWGRYGDVSRWVHEAGLQQVTTFHDSPAWVRPNDASASADKRPPTDMAAVREFGRRFAIEMGPRVQSIEFWNEPNSQFFAGPPWLYANALKHFSAGVKSTGADINLLLGSTAGRPGRFFENVYANGVARFVSHRNNHSYLDGNALAEFLRGEVRSNEDAAGLASLPGWLTELGYSLRRDGRGSFVEAEREQARHLVRSMAVAFGIGYERVFYFFFRELLEAEYHTWGIVRQDFSPRPSFAALAMMIDAVGRRPLYGALLSQGKSLVVFGSQHEGFVGIAWGNWLASDLGGSVSVVDIYGRPRHSRSMIGPDPVVITGFKDPPVQPAAVVRSEQAVRTPPGFLTVDLRGSSASQQNFGYRVEELAEEGALVHLRGIIASSSALRAPNKHPEVVCSGTKGLDLVAGPTFHSRKDLDGLTIECSFKVALAAIGRGSVAMSASGNGWRDIGRIDIVADAGSVSERLAAGGQLVEVCLDWKPRASSNVKLNLRSVPSAETRSCPMSTVVTGAVVSAGDTWVFPLSRIDALTKSAIGVVFDVSAFPGAGALPSRPLLLQLNDINGTVWIVELQASEREAHTTRYSGLFSLAMVAPWSKPSRQARLHAKDIESLSFGFGAHGGLPGERLAFRIDRQFVIPVK